MSEARARWDARWEADASPQPGGAHPLVRELAQALSPGARVLDVAAGRGRQSLALAQAGHRDCVFPLVETEVRRHREAVRGGHPVGGDEQGVGEGHVRADGDAVRAQRIRGAFSLHGNGEDVKLDSKGVRRHAEQPAKKLARFAVFDDFESRHPPQLRAPRRDHGPERA